MKWVKDDQIILERNDDYWGEKAKLDRIILKSIPEPSARLMALQSGTVDIADDLDPDSINLVKKEAKHAIIERPSINVGYLALNTENRRQRSRVRQAINHAIDKATLIKTIFQGLAVRQRTPLLLRSGATTTASKITITVLKKPRSSWQKPSSI